MATLEQVYNARHLHSLECRVESAVLLQSLVVLAEPPATVNHAERMYSADMCLTDAEYLGKFVSRLMISASANDAIASDPSGVADALIQAGVDSLYTSVALKMGA